MVIGEEDREMPGISINTSFLQELDAQCERLLTETYCTSCCLYILPTVAVGQPRIASVVGALYCILYVTPHTHTRARKERTRLCSVLLYFSPSCDIFK